MNQSVIIYGPQGCGKTVNAQRLMRHFGLREVVDESPELTRSVAPRGVLVLTCYSPPPSLSLGLRVLPFAEAMRLAGFTRSPIRSTPDTSEI